MASIFLSYSHEDRKRAERIANGIYIDETTWGQLTEIAQQLQVPV